jgi:hypothetical protein
MCQGRAEIASQRRDFVIRKAWLCVVWRDTIWRPVNTTTDSSRSLGNLKGSRCTQLLPSASLQFLLSQPPAPVSLPSTHQQIPVPSRSIARFSLLVRVSAGLLGASAGTRPHGVKLDSTFKIAAIARMQALGRVARIVARKLAICARKVLYSRLPRWRRRINRDLKFDEIIDPRCWHLM